ncbi:hypothetical protein C8Q80DRAFT_1319001 [Daedaleopsis nitida]|nr:hypothetical protein C8Q80DRAFT_1319001 [Daedaleopsis nitida]
MDTGVSATALLEDGSQGPLVNKLELTNYLSFPPDSRPPSKRLLDRGVTHLTGELVISDDPRRIRWLLSCFTRLPPGKVEIFTSLGDSLDHVGENIFLSALPLSGPGQHFSDLLSPSLKGSTEARLKLDNGNVCLQWGEELGVVSLNMASSIRGPAAWALHRAALVSAGTILSTASRLVRLECAGTFDGVDRAAWTKLLLYTRTLRQIWIRDLGAEAHGARTMFEALDVTPMSSSVGTVCHHLEQVEVVETKYSRSLLQAVVKTAEVRAQYRIGFKSLQLDLEPVVEVGKDRHGRALKSVVHVRNAPEGWHRILSRSVGQVHMPDL